MDEYLLGVIARIERRAAGGLRTLEQGHAGVTGWSALREIHQLAGDAREYHTEQNGRPQS